MRSSRVPLLLRRWTSEEIFHHPARPAIRGVHAPPGMLIGRDWSLEDGERRPVAQPALDDCLNRRCLSQPDTHVRGENFGARVQGGQVGQRWVDILAIVGEANKGLAETGRSARGRVG